MDEITYSDTLRHYRLNLGIVSEELENIRMEIGNIQELKRQGWMGKSADRTEEKLVNVKQQIIEIEEYVSDSIILINKILTVLEQTGL